MFNVRVKRHTAFRLRQLADPFLRYPYPCREAIIVLRKQSLEFAEGVVREPRRGDAVDCYDCATKGQHEPAVGTCVRCGAGLCATCVRLEEQRVEQHGTLGNPLAGATRTLLCASCDEVLADSHLHSVG
jgi:hypothetical protein